MIQGLVYENIRKTLVKIKASKVVQVYLLYVVTFFLSPKGKNIQLKK